MATHIANSILYGVKGINSCCKDKTAFGQHVLHVDVNKSKMPPTFQLMAFFIVSVENMINDVF